MEGIFVGVSIWLIVKIFVVITLLFYLVFALVVIRQVQLMIEAVEVGFENPLKLLSYVHFAFAVGVLLLAIVIL